MFTVFILQRKGAFKGVPYKFVLSYLCQIWPANGIWLFAKEGPFSKIFQNFGSTFFLSEQQFAYNLDFYHLHRTPLTGEGCVEMDIPWQLCRTPLTGEGCVEMDIPWQLCRTIGPLLNQRFPLASAKAQPRGGFYQKINK